ncbi:MAG: amidohydrolase [Rhizobiales bacterium]|nr:amidohydrolase [Hyphomicrobiales bacterium]
MKSDIIDGFAADLVAIRRDLHMHPELQFEEVRTAGIVARELQRIGFTVTLGIAGTGVIGTLSNGTSRRSIGLRADMDALPMTETTGLPYASRTPGKMHACGHDGHTTTLLGAARYLAETRNFEGTVHLIFQPAEEDISGARRMVDEGLFRRFPCDAIYAFHNLPGHPAGQVLFKTGPVTAAVDIARITVRGIGGHGAMPHKAADPIVAAAGIVLALQTAVSRNADPHEPAIVTVGTFHAGTISTVIPETATLDVSVRSCSPSIRKLMAARIPAIVKGQAESFGCTAEIDYELSYPPSVNTSAETELLGAVAAEVDTGHPAIRIEHPFMFSEDFSYMLEHVPGSYFAIGNGDGPNRKMLHDPGYDFNDEVLLKGTALWGRLVERFLPIA